MKKVLQDVGKENLEAGGRAELKSADTAKTAKQQPEPAFDDPGARATDQKENLAVANALPTLYDYKLTVDDLTSTAGPSEKYWEVLSERHRKVIEENQHLHTIIAMLEKENSACKRLMESVTDLINMLKDEVFFS